MMKHFIYFTFVLPTILDICLIGNIALANNSNNINQQPLIFFRENKGQVHDQNYKPRNDILFSGNNGNMTFHLKRNGMHYQLYRVDEWKEDSMLGIHSTEKMKIPAQTTFYRIDVSWKGANPNPEIEVKDTLPGYDNFYLASCPDGVLFVKSYQQIIYKNIYHGIDLVFHNKGNVLHYDFVVKPGADYKKIKIKIEGAESIEKTKDGNIRINTPLGEIIEGNPEVFQMGKQLPTDWLIHDNELSFEINNIDPRYPVIIDPPVRNWGTYYGGGDDDRGYACTTDNSGNVYMSGWAGYFSVASIFSTNGAHQTVFGGGSGTDAYLVKFDSTGTRLWGTYYGGAGSDFSYSCGTDVNDNIYISGGTSSTSAISTNGSHQSTPATGTNAFLVKFNSNGVRQWGTYYGGNSSLWGAFCHVSKQSNVYLVGYTSSTTGIATVGAYQTAYGGGYSDVFLIKFDNNGVRQWGTYYGGSGSEFSYSCTTDSNENVYLAGHSFSDTILATSGSYQPTIYGSNDGFLAKFNSGGTRIWATYFGGEWNEYIYSCATDAGNNVYIVGNSGSDSAIATIGSFKSVKGWGVDGFIAKFNSVGTRLWSTYFGGSDIETINGCTTDNNGNIYLAGTTESNSSIATSGSHQTTYTGPSDAFLAKFRGTGMLDWATYYGGTSIGVSGTGDGGSSCAVDPTGNVYLSGHTTAGNGISTTRSYQTIFGGGAWFDAFLVKFACTTPNQPDFINGPLTVCIGDSGISYSIPKVIDATSYTWAVYPDATITSGQGTDSIFVNFGDSSGNVTVSAKNACGVSAAKVLSVIVNTTKPNATVIPIADTICQGDSITLTASGGTFYLWNTMDTTASIRVSPTSDSICFVAVSANGCDSIPSPVNITVESNTIPIITRNISTPLCVGDSVQLTASPASGYQWSNGDTTQSIKVTSTDSFFVTVTYSNLCNNVSLPAVVKINTNPSPIITAGGATTLCQGQNVILDAGNNYSSYLWNTGDITQTITIDTAGIYFVSVTDSNGCNNNPVTSSITIVVNSLPVVSISGLDTVCEKDVVTLIASGGINYYWNTGATNDIITETLTLSSMYSVTVSDSNCTTKDSILITVLPEVSVSITGNSGPYCPEDSIVYLSANSSGGVWLGIGITDSIKGIFNPSNAGLGTHIISYVLNMIQCGGSDTAKIIVSNIIPIYIDSVTPLCDNDSNIIILTATHSGGIWYGNGIKDSIQGTFDPVSAGAGTHTVIYADSGSCIYYGSENITISLAPTINLGKEDTIGCGEEIVLGTGLGYISYLWQDGSTNETYIVKDSGNYMVTVTDTNACTAMGTIHFTLENCPNSILWIPNIFTPNKDNINDEFLIIGENIISFELMIFNRWGELLFDSKNINDRWDGTYKNKVVPNGVYVWTINYSGLKNGIRFEEKLKGYVAVLK